MTACNYPKLPFDYLRSDYLKPLTLLKVSRFEIPQSSDSYQYIESKVEDTKRGRPAKPKTIPKKFSYFSGKTQI